MTALGESSHGYLADVTAAVAPHLPQDTLNRWDSDLRDAIAERQAEEAAGKSDGWFYSMTSQWARMRQILALARGDLDLLISLEVKKKPHMQDTLRIAAQLLEVGRSAEALDWVRKPGRRSFGETDNGLSPERVSLEARILDATGDKPAAQALRWRCYEAKLSADILRDYLKQLPDFEDVEAEERAHTFALEKAEPEVALQFFLDWPQLDLAAKLIATHPNRWDGGDWHILPKVTGLLEHDHPLAATILYRALLDNILDRARSKAYGHGAKYLGKLALLTQESDATRPSTMTDHAIYLAKLKKRIPANQVSGRASAGKNQGRHKPAAPSPCLVQRGRVTTEVRLGMRCSITAAQIFCLARSALSCRSLDFPTLRSSFHFAVIGASCSISWLH